MQSIAAATENETYNPALRIGARVVSYVAHPLFIPVLVSALILYLHPIHNLILPAQTKGRLLAMVAINTVLFPALVVFLLWRLGFMKSIQMETQRERIIPLIANLTFYFWAFYVSRSVEGIPVALTAWLLAVFISSIAAMFFNIFRKISLHGIGMGSLVTYIAWQQAVDVHWPGGMWLVLAVLIAGITGTARLICKAHDAADVWFGMVAGAVSVCAAMLITYG